MTFLMVARHKTDKSTLQAIYAKYNDDWKPNQGTTYPTIWENFPKTVADGMFHKVIFVVEGDDNQIRNVTLLFFGLMEFTITPLYDVMTEKEVAELPDQYYT
jgi:hypothetical protein